MNASQFMAAVGNASYFDFVEIGEPESNSLRLVIAEMSVDSKESGGTPPVPGALPVRHKAQDRIFEIVWDLYAVYMVVNESFDCGNESDAFEGKLFRLYTRSGFLRFIEHSLTSLPELHPGYRHWAVLCANQIIHVIANVEPQVLMR